jgi:hypothetical protein
VTSTARLLSSSRVIFQITTQPDCLHVTASGEFSLEKVQASFRDILDAVAQHGHKKVLFDGRKVSGEPTVMERFWYGEYVARCVTSFAARTGLQAPKFAYVLIPPVLDPKRHGENVAVNRGMNVRAFDNLPDAMTWLQFGDM